jgi:hypothetical protein
MRLSQQHNGDISQGYSTALVRMDDRKYLCAPCLHCTQHGCLFHSQCCNRAMFMSEISP